MKPKSPLSHRKLFSIFKIALIVAIPVAIVSTLILAAYIVKYFGWITFFILIGLLTAWLIYQVIIGQIKTKRYDKMQACDHFPIDGDVCRNCGYCFNELHENQLN